MKASNRKNNRGFTLAELLVAVALIGILVSVSVVIFTGRTAEAKENVCKANRDAMQHGTVVISMTERVNWQEEYKTKTAGLHSQVSEDIILYLVTEEYIDDFKCPAGGTIYADSVEEDLVTFKCTYHDDGMEPGSENVNNQAAKDLADAVNKYINNGYDGLIDNDAIVRAFMQTDASEKYVIPGTTKDILTESVINFIVKEMLRLGKITEEDAEKFRKSLVDYSEEEVYLVPYVGKSVKEGNAVLTYYTSKKDYNNYFKVSDGKKHGVSGLICFEGKWYISTNIHNYSKSFSPTTLMQKFTFSKNIRETLEQLEKEELIIAI